MRDSCEVRYLSSTMVNILLIPCDIERNTARNDAFGAQNMQKQKYFSCTTIRTGASYLLCMHACTPTPTEHKTVQVHTHRTQDCSSQSITEHKTVQVHTHRTQDCSSPHPQNTRLFKSKYLLNRRTHTHRTQDCSSPHPQNTRLFKPKYLLNRRTHTHRTQDCSSQNIF